MQKIEKAAKPGAITADIKHSAHADLSTSAINLHTPSDLQHEVLSPQSSRDSRHTIKYAAHLLGELNSKGTVSSSATLPDIRVHELVNALNNGATWLGNGLSCDAYLLKIRGVQLVLKVPFGTLGREHESEGQSDNFSSLHMLKREAMNLAYAQIHGLPGLPRFYGTVRDEKNRVVAVLAEFINGPKLSELIEEGRLNARQAMRLIRSTLRNFRKTHHLHLWDVQLYNFRVEFRGAEVSRITLVDAAALRRRKRIDPKAHRNKLTALRDLCREAEARAHQ